MFFPLVRGIPRRYIEGTPYNSSALTTQKFTVPDDKVWFVVSVCMLPADAATTAVTHHDKDDKQLNTLLSGASGTVAKSGPEQNTGDTAGFLSNLAFEGDYIKFVFGANQSSAGSYVMLTVIEYDIKEIWRTKK